MAGGDDSHAIGLNDAKVPGAAAGVVVGAADSSAPVLLELEPPAVLAAAVAADCSACDGA